MDFEGNLRAAVRMLNIGTDEGELLTSRSGHFIHAKSEYDIKLAMKSRIFQFLREIGHRFYVRPLRSVVTKHSQLLKISRYQLLGCETLCNRGRLSSWSASIHFVL